MYAYVKIMRLKYLVYTLRKLSSDKYYINKTLTNLWYPVQNILIGNLFPEEAVAFRVCKPVKQAISITKTNNIDFLSISNVYVISE